MAEWTIYGSNGAAKATVKELELHDEWMAECFITVSVKSAAPIDFSVGDYIDYRNERYSINYDPSKIKKARRNTYGEGFVYDNIKFVAVQDELVRCDFCDIVLSDNNIHYTQLPTFPFYCETVDDLLDRIQANLEELYPGGWIIISPDLVRDRQRGFCVGREQAFVNAYNQYIGEGSEYEYEKTGVALTVDNINCWEALAKAHNDFLLDFIIRGRTVIVGTAGVFTSNKFRYGKGNGLYEIEVVGDSEQKVVTRLRAYGSENNLPERYYSTKGGRPFFNVSEIPSGSSTEHGISVIIDNDRYYNVFNDEAYEVSSSHKMCYGSCEMDGIAFDAVFELLGQGGTTCTTRMLVSADGYPVAPYIEGHTVPQSVIDALKSAMHVGSQIIFNDGVNISYVDKTHIIYSDTELPENMAVNRLMLPGFPDMSLDAWARANRPELIDEGFTFSTNTVRPYIDSPNKDLYGIRPSNIFFDGSNETDEIYPTIEGMTWEGHACDVVVSADIINDNGVLPENAKESEKRVTITIPYAGFDMDKKWTEESTISMKDGMCGARDFKILKKPTQDNNGNWVCVCERAYDSTLHLYFPYSDFQIHSGDHFVLTGIELPDSYVDAASIRLFDAAMDALRKNHLPRVTFQPKIDHIWMARQHDTAMASGGVVKSLHDTLKAGDYFSFADSDLGIDADIIIDILTIKENGDNGIPTYEITLRDEKQVSTFEKRLEKIASSASSGAGGGNMNTRQIGSLVEQYGRDLFLSKIDDDNAQGVIGLLKGAWFGAKEWFINATGTANLFDATINGVLKAYNAVINTVKSVNFSGYGMLDTGWSVVNDYEGTDSYAVFDRLYIRKKAIFEELELRKISHIGGNFCLSPASGRAYQVEYYDASGKQLGIEEKTVPWVLGYKVLMLFSRSMANKYLGKRKMVDRPLTEAERKLVKRVRVYLFSDDGSTKTMSNWTVGAQARCQTFNIEEQMDYHGSGEDSDNPDVSYWTGKKVQNTYWWRLVSAVGEGWLRDGKKHSYIEFLCNTGTPEDEYVVADTGSDLPAVGDEFGQFGHRTDTSQQNVIMIETANPDSPSIKFYRGVNSWSLEGKRKTMLSPMNTEIYSQRYHIETAYDDVIVPMDRGAWVSGTEYYYYDRVSHNGSLWLCVIPEGRSTTDEPSDTSVAWLKQVAKGDKGDKGDKGTNATTTALKYTGPLSDSATKPTVATYKNFTWTDNIPTQTEAKPNVYVGVWEYDAATTLDINTTAPVSVSLFAHYGKTGETGDDGKNGTSILAAPNAIIINQQRTSEGAEPLDNISYPIVVVARDSGTIVPATISSLTKTNCSASISNNGKTSATVTITAISYTGSGSKKKYKTSGAVGFHVTAQTAKGDTFQADISVPFGCNLLGQYTIDIEEDVKTEIAEKVAAQIDEDGVLTVTNFDNTYVNSSKGTMQVIKKTVDELKGNGTFDYETGFTNSRLSTAEENINTISIDMLDVLDMDKWEQGTTNGASTANQTYSQIKSSSTTRIRTKTLIPVTRGTVATLGSSSYDVYFAFFGSNKKTTGSTSGWKSGGGDAITLGQTTGDVYAAILLRKSNGGTITPSDLAEAKLYISDSSYSTRKQTATDISDMVVTPLGSAGITLDGTNSKIEAKANHFTVVNSSGDTTFSVDENGNLKSSGSASFNGKVTATSGKIGGFTINSSGDISGSDATFSGKISASGGDIGGFKIGSKKLSNTAYNASINIQNAASSPTQVAKIGKDATDAMTGLSCSLQAESTKSGTYNTALYLKASGATYNYAFHGEGNGVLNGLVFGFKTQNITIPGGSTGASADILLRNGSTIILSGVHTNGHVTMMLPTLSEVRSCLGLDAQDDITPFAIEIDIINRSNYEYLHIGFSPTIGINTVYPRMMNFNNEPIANYTRQLAEGDYIKIKLVYYGKYYNGYILINNN